MEADIREPSQAAFPARVRVDSALVGRNRVTTAFRLILAIPHLVLVGGPVGGFLTWNASSEGGWDNNSGGSGGVMGIAAVVAAIISWFGIVFAGIHPDGLWKFSAFYLRWRARSIAYVALLRDEYPPFGEGPYAVELDLDPPSSPRNRLTVAFRTILLIPHALALAVLSIAWLFGTVIAWFAIIFTGRYPESLYDFSVGMLRWSMRFEAYILLLHDAYPPFSLE